ncbi:MAG: hypothetical protein R3Y66_08080 [Rikenellaceae bacterium]
MVATEKQYKRAKRLMENYCFDEEYFIAESIIESYDNGTEVSKGYLQYVDGELDIEMQCNGTIRFI